MGMRRYKAGFVKMCEVCGDLYKPHPCSRAKSKTCSRRCGGILSQRSKAKGHLREQAIALANDGQSVRQIAKALGVGRTTAWKLSRGTLPS